GQVDGLATDHALGAGGARQQGGHAKTGLRLPTAFAADPFESQRLQGVARQDGGGLVEGAMAGRAPAAQVVVVHGRQVIVDQRIGMDQFYRPGGDVHCRLGNTEGLAAGVGQHRAYPLAAAGDTVAHGGVEPLQPRVLVVELLLQIGVDALLAGLEIVFERSHSTSPSKGAVVSWPSCSSSCATFCSAWVSACWHSRVRATPCSKALSDSSRLRSPLSNRSTRVCKAPSDCSKSTAVFF